VSTALNVVVKVFCDNIMYITDISSWYRIGKSVLLCEGHVR